MDKALLVFDQVPHGVLADHLARHGLHAPTPVRLDYIPRTTPVGHATISTGMPPSKHRVQGRAWRDRAHTLHEIKHIVARRPPRVFEHIEKSNLAAQLRARGTRGIVACAAKDFIPFLFGAWECDISMYPRTVAPESIGPGALVNRIGFEIILDAWTTNGVDALRDARNDLAARFAALANVVARCDLEIGPAPSVAPGALVLRWALPAAWGSLPFVLKEWKTWLPALADGIDDFYTDVSVRLLDYLPAPRALLQSCFAPDAAGHRDGPASPAYRDAVERCVVRTRALHARGWRVAVVSDHGGRDTPESWQHDPRAGSIFDGVTTHYLPEAVHQLLSGDHVVGYAVTNGPDFHGLDRRHLTPLTVDADLIRRSFHPQQIPSWVVVPPMGARFGARFGRGGGDHGACHENGMISDIDNVVGVWTLPPTPPSVPLPMRLDEVAGWFLALP